MANLQVSTQLEWKPLPSHSWNLPDSHSVLLDNASYITSGASSRINPRPPLRLALF